MVNDSHFRNKTSIHRVPGFHRMHTEGRRNTDEAGPMSVPMDLSRQESPDCAPLAWFKNNDLINFCRTWRNFRNSRCASSRRRRSRGWLQLSCNSCTDGRSRGDEGQHAIKFTWVYTILDRSSSYIGVVVLVNFDAMVFITPLSDESSNSIPP